MKLVALSCVMTFFAVVSMLAVANFLDAIDDCHRYGGDLTRRWIYYECKIPGPKPEIVKSRSRT